MIEHLLHRWAVLHYRMLCVSPFRGDLQSPQLSDTIGSVGLVPVAPAARPASWMLTAPVLRYAVAYAYSVTAAAINKKCTHLCRHMARAMKMHVH